MSGSERVSARRSARKANGLKCRVETPRRCAFVGDCQFHSPNRPQTQAPGGVDPTENSREELDDDF